MLEQEKQVGVSLESRSRHSLTPYCPSQNAALRKHIMLLEGGDSGGATVIGVHSAGGGGGSTVDDVRTV